jgi:prepilin-type N-terminal cleavage/methylation domain-containing protein
MRDRYKSGNILGSTGYTLLEVLIVIAVLGALAAIALPQYLIHVHRTEAAACAANRRNIEMIESAQFIQTQRADLSIPEHFRCPSGGEYVWIYNDPQDSRYPKIGCSIHGWRAIPPEGDSPPLFESNFDSMENLVPLLGNWETTNDGLGPRNPGEHRLAFGDRQWTDYTLSINATLESGPGYGIYFRADGEKRISGYVFQYDPGYGDEFLVRRVFNGKEEKAPFQRAKFPEGFSVYDQSRELSITTRGNITIIQVDGATIFEFQDDTFTAGMAGLRTWSNTSATFHDVRVDSLKETTP